MNTSLAWHNLLHKRIRTGVAVAGITFAIVLMFMQLGFLEAVKASATVTYDALDFDICIRSTDYLHVADARAFPRERLAQAASTRGIRRTAGVQITSNSWRNPQNGERRAILCVGVRPDQQVFRNRAIQQKVRHQLISPNALLIDNLTRSEYGPQNGQRFGPRDHGIEIELNSTTVRIVGDFTCGTGLSASGGAIMSERGLVQATPWISADEVSLGLLKISHGQDPEQLARNIARRLPDDVDVKSRRQVLKSELSFWVYETNYGLIFQTGVLVAVVVGTAIVYQVLASDVANMLPEYATLKAIGYSNRYLAVVILQQAGVLAVLSFTIGVAIAVLLYWITTAGAQIPVRMTGQNLFIVGSLSLGMCLGSGLAAARKAFRGSSRFILMVLMLCLFEYLLD